MTDQQQLTSAEIAKLLEASRRTADPQELLTTREVSELLKISYATLMTWRSSRRYPLRYIRVGRHIRYRRSDIEQFLAEQTV